MISTEQLKNIARVHCGTRGLNEDRIRDIESEFVKLADKRFAELLADLYMLILEKK